MVDMKCLDLKKLVIKSKEACWMMASIDTKTKNNVLDKLAIELEKRYDQIQAANQKDLIEAEKLVQKGKLSNALYKRLALTENKFREMVQGVRDVARLEDPVGKIQLETELDDDLVLKRISSPIGVIGVIFEARPEVVVQITSLAIKSANAVILKGGSEAINTNIELVNIIKNLLKQFNNVPENAISLITTREEVKSMLAFDQYIDLIIPRGSNAFVKFIQNNTRIPVLGHADGICHIYIDKNINQKLAEEVCMDSKTDYPSGCNAVETILVHEAIVSEYLPAMVELFIKNGVEVRLEKSIIEKYNFKNVKEVTEEDWSTEYTDMIISIKVVSSLEQAVDHINKYGSGHTDCIITEDSATAEQFMNTVDSAGVYQNVSTRFADGFRYGFGAEVGISTNKTHARGPVGLEGLMIYKYKLYGKGQVVADYSKGLKSFKHRKIK